MGKAIRIALASLMIAFSPGGSAWWATEWTQIGNVAVNTDAWLESKQTQLNTLRQLRNMIEQAKHWTDVLAENPEAILGQVAEQTHQGMAISYALSNMEARFRQVYKSYDEFVVKTYDRQAFNQDYQSWSQTTTDSIEHALKASGIQMDSLADEASILQQLRVRLAESGQSRNKAIQVTGDINAMNVAQLQKLRQLLSTNMQIQTAWINEQNAERKVTQAKRNEYFKLGADQPIVGNAPPIGVPAPRGF